MGRKESVGIPNIHKIALEDRIKPIENFQGFYPLKSWPPSNSDSHLSLLSQNPKAPLVAPERKLVTVRWLPRKTSPRLKRERSPICPQVGVSQWRAGEGEDYPMEGTLETITFRNFVERGLTLPMSEFCYRLL